ncbi:MAG: TerC family protein [Planctomycetes bacterium]|nr:TerC family protein [Planctomycetota bacterium]
MPLETAESMGSPLLWGGFLVFVLAMLALDLGVFHRKAHAVSLREAAIWSGIWIGFAALFAAGIHAWFGPERALEFTTGYVIEKALSVDNIFVFVVIFSYFAIPNALQHRVLFWGILGALIMRAIFIVVGGAFLAKFHWAIYVFGAILVLTGIKLLLQRNAHYDPAGNPVVKLFKRFFPVSDGFDGQKFFTRQGARLVATPLVLALLVVEATDVVFAVDSIPAIFAITKDPFIVFTSNIFAILGLRSLYFLLAGVIDKFRYLKLGLAFVLVFVGAKMLGAEMYKVPVVVSLGVIGGILGLSVLASLVANRRNDSTRSTEGSTP